MPEPLTSMERRIYDFVVDYLKRETHQPSIREIGSRLGIRSTKTVTEHLEALQRKGYLDRTPSRSRALKILGLNLSPETYSIPLYRDLGRLDEADARFELDSAFVESPACFLVRVSGDHLGGTGVLDGDMILVDPGDDLKNGDTAVVENGGQIELRAVDAGQADAIGPGVVLGAARGLLRSFPANR